MQIRWKHIRRAAAWFAAFVVAIAVTAPIGNFFIVWADQNGWYKDPNGRVRAVIQAAAPFFQHLGDITASPWFHWIGGGIVGFALGAWIDKIMRNSEERAVAQSLPTPDFASPIPVSLPGLLAGPAFIQPPPLGFPDPIAEQIPADRMTTRTPDQLLALFDGRNPLQAAPLIQPYVGQWIKVSGIVMKTIDGGIDVVALVRSSARPIECRFPKTWTNVLLRYDPGDRLEAQGIIAAHQNGQQLYLTNCQVIR